jgi:predicted DCC family thiol-disulfide oxidoreductase YuxK
MGAVVLFDGVCNLCSASVHFIVDRDRDAFFKFASIQSDIAKELMKEHGVAFPEGDPSSIILVEDGQAFDRSSAALRIARHLNGIWKLGWLLIVVPRFVRDALYEVVAKHRYRWFGKKDVCMVPTPALRARFL